MAHCDLNGSKDKEGFSYNPILESKLNSLGFDYSALGHIHKNNLDNKNRIYYPGSTIALGFDELGEHGMIVGELTKDSFTKQFSFDYYVTFLLLLDLCSKVVYYIFGNINYFVLVLHNYYI